MTRPIGTGPAGAAGSVTVASGIQYPGIAPSTSINVRDELDFRARNVGAWKIIATEADYEFHYPASGGVHTVTAPTLQTATVVLPAGRRVHIAATGSLRGQFGVQTALVGDVAGPLVSGDPLRLDQIAVANANAGGTQIDGTSTTGATTILRNVVLTSPISPTPICPAGPIHDLTAGGIVVIENINIDAQTAGLTFGGNLAAARIVGSSISNMPPGAIAYTVGPTTVVSVGMAWQGSIFLTTDSAQRIVRIDPAATVPNTPVTVPTSLVGMRLTNNAIAPAGAIGAVMDETGIDESDIRVISTGSLYGGRSRFLGSVTFVNSVTPISKTYSAANVFEPIPRSNGAGGNITIVPSSERFDLQTPGADPPGEWYVRYLGPLPIAAVRVEFAASIQAASTSSIIMLRLEKRATALGSWVPVAESERTRIQVNNSPGYVGGSGTVSLAPDDHFRVTVANDTQAATTEFLQISVTIVGAI